MATLEAPFPYFGGKARVAGDVWEALGDVAHYIEPFFGSGAVLLARPGGHAAKIETVNDADGYVANVWRALQFAPDEVARWCDWPVNHADLVARKAALLRNRKRLLSRLSTRPEWYDATMAGYWIWAASCWIGHGLTCPNQIPRIANPGTGVHKLSVRGTEQIPHLGTPGMGVHKLSVRADPPDQPRHVQGPYNTAIYDWFRKLSDRLRNVRVVCGDWRRVCGGDWQDNMGTVGLFFDPPYSDVAERVSGIYDCDSETVAHDVRAWCLERGTRETHRIVLAGYYDEHAELLDHGWTVKRWSAAGGYSTTVRKADSTARGAANRHNEALFFSPHCLGLSLWDMP